MAPRDYASALKQQLPVFEDVLATRIVRPAHLIPDIVALSLAREVYEHSLATALLWDSPASRAAYASARGAFENFQDLVYLMHADDYDLIGSRARAAEFLDVSHSRELQASARAATGHPVPPSKHTVEAALEVDAAAWDEVAPGKGALLHTALAAVRADRKRRRFHWSGLLRSDLSGEMVQILGGEDIDPIFRAWYSQLSFFTHPSLHSGPEYFDPKPDGTVAFRAPQGDEMPLGTAFIAATLIPLLLVERLPTKPAP